MRRFEEIVVEYPPADLCTYPEYRGKPYFSIKYEENGEHFVGFGTYKPDVLSQYLKEYFMKGAEMAIHLTRDEKAKRYDALQVAIKTEREAFMQREKEALQKYKDASVIGAYNKGLADAYEQAVDSLGRWIE